MREIVLDTETTGLDPVMGHRIVEIGCVEIINLLPTGKTFWTYLNPERDIPDDATRIHGITNEFVQDKPLFIDIAKDFLEFIGDSPLIIHNAAFDMKFLNNELRKASFKQLPDDRAKDTVKMARQKFPGSSVSLDSLCRRFNIDNSNRTFHGALLDSELLAEVYLELRGGRQPDLAVEVVKESTTIVALDRKYRAPRDHAPTQEELAAHADFMAKFKTSLWASLLTEDEPEQQQAAASA